MLDILVQPKRDTRAAVRFFRRLLKDLEYVPHVVVTDKPRHLGQPAGPQETPLAPALHPDQLVMAQPPRTLVLRTQPQSLDQPQLHLRRELETRIDCWASHGNDNPEPFVRAKPADEILDEVARGRATLDRIAKSATHRWLRLAQRGQLHLPRQQPGLLTAASGAYPRGAGACRLRPAADQAAALEDVERAAGASLVLVAVARHPPQLTGGRPLEDPQRLMRPQTPTAGPGSCCRAPASD
ncbi:hypothetical protein [Streptomyces sp. NPDC050388]|uniref:hypothetical protein n=1 Tax=Streptomyces sp. NPDC050388 TaxID=3155781 RepID=UPI003415362C